MTLNLNCEFCKRPSYDYVRRPGGEGVALHPSRYLQIKSIAFHSHVLSVSKFRARIFIFIVKVIETITRQIERVGLCETRPFARVKVCLVEIVGYLRRCLSLNWSYRIVS